MCQHHVSIRCWEHFHKSYWRQKHMIFFLLSSEIQFMQLQFAWWIKLDLFTVSVYPHRPKGVCVKKQPRLYSQLFFFLGQIFIWILLTNKLAPLGIHTNSWRAGYVGYGGSWPALQWFVCECEFSLLIVAWTNESRFRHTGVRTGRA